MKSFLLLISSVLWHGSLFAGNKDSVTHYLLPDSVKAVSFIAQATVNPYHATGVVQTGIQTDQVRLYLSATGKEKALVFEFSSSAKAIVTGLNVQQENNRQVWPFEWKTDQPYKLLIVTASDSAAGFSLYSGYVFLPGINKWKLIGTCKITGLTTGIKSPASFTSGNLSSAIVDPWCQRMNGSWKHLLGTAAKPPQINLFSHIDSLQQWNIEKGLVEQDMQSGKITVMDTLAGIYYTMMKAGTGNQVSVNDTVTIFYKGYLYTTNEVFDQTKEKPATFPLNRLIRGWQIGVPLVKEGGKIKLVIPSALAYSIRTRAAKIPPNSILVFEIEVVRAKKP